MSQELMPIVLDINRNLKSRTTEYAFVLAHVLSYRSSISKATSTAEAYGIVLNEEFNKLLSEVNSLTPVDVKAVAAYAKAFAAWRFDQMQGNTSVSYARDGKEVSDFFGLSKYFDEETIRCIEKSSTDITRYSVKIRAIIEYIDNKNKCSN